jgi:hypothetical protein
LERATLAPDGETIAIGGEAGLALTARTPPHHLVRLADSQRPLQYLGFSADQKWLVTGYGYSDGVEIYDVAARRHHKRLRTGGRYFAFSPDQRRLLSGSSQAYGFWAVGSWDPVFQREFEEPEGAVLTGCGFGHDGGLVFFTDPVGRLHLRSVATDEPMTTMESFEPVGAWGIAHDPAGRRFAAWSSRSVVHLWELAALRAELNRLGLDWTDDRDALLLQRAPVKPIPAGREVSDGGKH